MEEKEQQYECSICGRVPGPREGCQTCGGDKRYTQARNYTLSEVRSGNAPDEYVRRNPYSEEVGPTIVTDLPGAGGLGGSF